MKIKTYKHIFVVLAVGIFIAPQIALAVWWNPLSWRIWDIFRPTPNTQQVQEVPIATTTVVTSTTPTKKTESNQAVEIEKLRNEVATLKKSNQSPVQKSQKQTTPPVTTNNIPTPQEDKDAGESYYKTNHTCVGLSGNQYSYSYCLIYAFSHSSITATDESTTVVIPPTNIAEPTTVQYKIPKVSNSNLEDALDRFYGQSVLRFVTTAAPHLARMAGLITAKFDILQNGRDRCSKDYANQLEMRTKGPLFLSMLPEAKEKMMSALLEEKELCLLGYPQVDSSTKSQIEQTVRMLDTLYRKAQNNPASVSEINSIMQEYNSIEAQIYSFNDSIPSPIFRASLPTRSVIPSSPGSFSCSPDAGGTGNYSCQDYSSGVSTYCSSSVAGSWSCTNSNAKSIYCRTNTLGIDCSY